MHPDLQPVLEAREGEDYVVAHVLLMEFLEQSSDPDALLLLAENVLEWCPKDEDPFAVRKEAAESALTTFREARDEAGEARALMILATTDRDRSRELANESLTIARKLGDKVLTARALCHLGNNASIAGRNQEAVRTIKEGVRFAEESGDVESLADSLFVLGVSGEQEAFERMAQLQPMRKRRFARRLAAAASLISDREPELATAWNNRCIAIARAVSDPQFEGSVLRGIAQIERARGNTAKAEELNAMAAVMCPLPDLGDVVNAAEKGDVSQLWKALKTALGIDQAAD
jgi:hypothetical protein